MLKINLSIKIICILFGGLRENDYLCSRVRDKDSNN
jgi:hypothetical protein